MRITEIFKKQKHTFSFEFFPPKDEITAVEFGINAGQLMRLQPSFISVTYGAGGSTQERTFNLVDLFQNKLGLTCMAHYTCVNASAQKVSADLDYLYSRNIENLMLLRGDPPKGQQSFIATSADFTHASDLIRLAKSQNRFSIGAACYPEMHIESRDTDEDMQFVKEKTEAGADFLVTQMFFDNSFYYRFVERARAAGITCRIIPGIIPVINYHQIKKFVEVSNATIPRQLATILESYKDNEKKSYQIGVDLAINQCEDLLNHGAPGIHFYTLNKSRAVIDIYESLSLRYKC